jgi:hypothetical protein
MWEFVWGRIGYSPVHGVRIYDPEDHVGVQRLPGAEQKPLGTGTNPSTGQPELPGDLTRLERLGYYFVQDIDYTIMEYTIS